MTEQTEFPALKVTAKLRREIEQASEDGLLGLPDPETLARAQRVYRKLIEKGQQERGRIDRAYQLVVTGLWLSKTMAYRTSLVRCECLDFHDPRRACKHVLAGWMINGRMVVFDDVEEKE